MAYKRSAPVAKLTFDDYEGLEVQAKAPSMGALLELTDLAGQADTDPKVARKLMEDFAHYLVSWTVEDDNGPVPADISGLLSLDTPFVMEIIQAWIKGIAGVDPTSKPGSSPGQTVESSIPMTSQRS